jgi:hypothetical protein
VFYNDSAFDGDDPLANALDDAAIAPDKSPLLPGGAATFANYTSYQAGINGVMIDVSAVPTAPTLADFVFRVGNSQQVSSWSAPAALPTVALRRGAGVGGSDRITLTWPNLAIRKQWLQVTLLATPRTGLSAADVFYFGNAVGETGGSPNSTVVNASDEVAVRINPRSLANPAPIDSRYDFNRDALVNASDQILARLNVTTLVNSLVLLAPSAAAPLAAQEALALAAAGQPELSLTPGWRRRWAPFHGLRAAGG